jgi:NAD(P)H-dependent FMN reductase
MADKTTPLPPSTSASKTFKTIVFLGSGRNVVAPWGGDKRLGDRVVAHVKAVLKARKASFDKGKLVMTHDVTVFDPVEVFGKGGALESSGGHMETPHFYLGKSAPAKMNSMAETIKKADCYIIVTPEYNHSIPPALSSIMGHFGGSNYKGKPSAIVSYSPSPWGGARGAVALRPFLSELGCLPVSAMTHLPTAGALFAADGTPKDCDARVHHQLPKMLAQLEWTAMALKEMAARHGAFP